MAGMRPPAGWMALHFIDVGQGDAALLEFPCGTALVDAGGEDSDNARFAAYLDAFFDARPERQRFVDVVVLSHSHDDHNRGVEYLRADPKFDVGAVVDSGKDLDGGADRQRLFRAWVKRHGGTARSVKTESIEFTDGVTDDTIDPIEGCDANDEDPTFRVVSGGWSFDTGGFKKANDHSVVLRVDWGESSFLFTGDLEDEHGKGGIPEMLYYYGEDLAIFDVDVWKVGHHASPNGISEDLLRAMTPRIALIGVGDDESSKAKGYGHPRDLALALLTDDTLGVTCRRQHAVVHEYSEAHGEPHPRELDHAIFGTGWDGNIVLLAHPDGRMAVHVDGAAEDQLEDCGE
ncbi:MBL fold metallo-hydrolase [Lysobacter sp. A6]|uniref:MBL fold metallo-hydrolase n=1 Tax=Noviluteimonas lactosilytica TaxID=2888523 RepID=A0ABS8JEI6_9GAMM|nr:MBL fold metallo-hydrolase [Lysobacter lactosilyticus]MCC8361903.1 MBL fold metallo-hydrolase [Lysobacter lactosilyticus]